MHLASALAPASASASTFPACAYASPSEPTCKATLPPRLASPRLAFTYERAPGTSTRRGAPRPHAPRAAASRAPSNDAIPAHATLHTTLRLRILTIGSTRLRPFASASPSLATNLQCPPPPSPDNARPTRLAFPKERDAPCPGQIHVTHTTTSLSTPLVLGRRCHATVAHKNGAARTRRGAQGSIRSDRTPRLRTPAAEPAPAPAARSPPSSCQCSARLALSCDTARSLSVHISTACAPAFASAFSSTLPARAHASAHTFPSSADYARPPSRLAPPSFHIEHIHRTTTPPTRPQASASHINSSHTPLLESPPRTRLRPEGRSDSIPPAPASAL
ncbi:hypothetical protein DFH08DRAFT_821187 [Mycena albidolilacea]|uniref:Uncharacterized protein n=1 Tax=Mycena albidolilacea TaxID=1033008 RepID=A0AAD6ZBF3_9AGAR|nr:hypothetical protein DFH08DRAFT_821187 [Mycena albidolilacea]